MDFFDINLKQAVRSMTAVLVFFLFILAGCQGQTIMDTVFPASNESQGILEPTLAKQPLPVIDQTATPSSPSFFNLILWLPPQFDPAGDGDASFLIKERIQKYLVRNPQVNLDVRIKALAGPGNLMEALAGAHAAAQEALPSLVLLSRADLVQAVDKNLLYPLEEMSNTLDEDDWYRFSRDLAIYQGTVYGLPFSANVLSLMYRRNLLTNNQPSWEEILSGIDTLAFPAGDPEEIVTLTLYQSANGNLTGQSGQPDLDSEKLSRVFGIYNQAYLNGLIDQIIMDFQTDEQSWQYFVDNQADAVITWANRSLSEGDDFHLALLPSLAETPYTVGSGWVWCLTEPDRQKRAYAADLAEFLTDPEFLADWAPVSGLLPVRPSSLNGYADKAMQSTINKLLQSAHVRPEKELASIIGAAIKPVLTDVFLGIKSPLAGAEDAALRLEEPRTQ